MILGCLHKNQILRQYAFLDTLLKGSFLPSPPSSLEQEDHLEEWSVDMTLSTAQGPKLAVVFPRAKPNAPSPSAPDQNGRDLLSRLLSNTEIASQDTVNSSSIAVTIEILPNAEISILDQNLVRPDIPVTQSTDNGQEAERQKNNLIKLSRALAISSDIGIWTEWASKWSAGLS
jgi:hypothetical protein